MPCPNITTSSRIQYLKNHLAISDHEALQVSEMFGKQAADNPNNLTNIALDKLVELVASDPEPAFWLYTLLVSQFPEEQ